MPKATLTFDLSDPEDRRQHALVLQAADYRQALAEIMEAWRQHHKYDGPVVTQAMCCDILAHNEIDLWE